MKQMRRIYFYISILLLAVMGCSREIEPVLADDALEESEIKTLNDGTQLKLTNLGPQLFDTAISTAAFYEDGQGRKYLYAVVTGEPAHLLGYDLNDNNRLITDIALGSAITSNSMVFSGDGTLYIIGEKGGNIFAYTIGSTSVRDLGVALNNETTLYDLNVGEDGAIYGGTYPGGKVFRYHPQEGFSNLGSIATGRNYVRSLVYHKGSHKIYAGMGTGAQLIEFDIATGTKRNILPESYGDQEFLYQLTLVEGIEGGDRLFMTLQNANVTLIYNLETGTFSSEIKSVWVQGMIKSSVDNTVYYTRGANNLYAFDNLATDNFEQRQVTGISGNARAAKIFGNVLYVFSNTGQLLRYDLIRKVASTNNVDIPGQPRQLNVVHEGPNGSVWTSGYQYGANAFYDVVTKKTTAFTGLNQTESAALYDTDYIYFGTYTQARMYKYNNRLPWLMGSNPKLIATVPGQDRPFGAIAVPHMGKVFFGTVPNYGANGGVLVEFDVKSNDKVSYHTVIDDQSIISLAEQDGKLFGGSSIWGGLGSVPVATEAKLFVWDIASGIKVHEVVPVPGAKFISCLINGYDGYIWGIAQGHLFKIDPEDYSVVSSTKIYNDGRASHVWRPDMLVRSPRDYMYYGSIGNNLFRLDPETLALERLNETGGHLTLGGDGSFYFIRASDLWKMEVR